MEVIVCVLKSGVFKNSNKIVQYTAEHVEFLRNQVRKNMKSPYRFICLSDVEVDCERIPLEENWAGWWSKIELFKHFKKAFYIDLDTVITGDITEMVKYPHKFTMLRNMSKHNGAVGSGLMAWNGDYSHIYHEFKKSPAKYIEKHNIPTSWGDQGFIQNQVENITLFQNIWKDCVLSYKFDLDRGKIATPKECKMIAYHGKPKPWEV